MGNSPPPPPKKKKKKKNSCPAKTAKKERIVRVFSTYYCAGPTCFKMFLGKIFGQAITHQKLSFILQHKMAHPTPCQYKNGASITGKNPAAPPLTSLVIPSFVTCSSIPLSSFFVAENVPPVINHEFANEYINAHVFELMRSVIAANDKFILKVPAT